MLYICYLISFYDTKIWALLDLNNKVNVIIFVFVHKSGFSIQKIDIGAQKVNRSILKLFEIIIIDFLLEDDIKKLNSLKNRFY